jgi:hypothetical protein
LHKFGNKPFTQHQPMVKHTGNNIIESILPVGLVLLSGVVFVVQTANGMGAQYKGVFSRQAPVVAQSSTLSPNQPASVESILANADAETTANNALNTVSPAGDNSLTEAVETAGALGDTQATTQQALTVDQAIYNIEKAITQFKNLDPNLVDILTKLALAGHQLGADQTMTNVDNFNQKYNTFTEYMNFNASTTPVELAMIVSKNSGVIRNSNLSAAVNNSINNNNNNTSTANNNQNTTQNAANDICQQGGNVSECVK